ncbi:MAG TPA: zf-HC2 domain-containing protein [Amycolatopsis sp.]|jgi:predicted anti-sigma-YlaC factor YlaD
MNCDRVREELSAALDGELSPAAADRLAEHLSGCADCRNWQDAAHLLTRLVRLTPARPGPDLTPRILDAVLADRAAHRRPDRNRRLARIGLAAAAVAQFVIILPALFLGDAGAGVPPHASRELGAFNLALAVGFAAASLRPARARGMLPLVGVATGALVVLSIVDTAYGQTTLAAELPHVITVAGWLLLFLLARVNRGDPDGPDRAADDVREGGWWGGWRRPFSGFGRLSAGISTAVRFPATAKARPATVPFDEPPGDPGPARIAA